MEWTEILVFLAFITISFVLKKLGFDMDGDDDDDSGFTIHFDFGSDD